MQLRFIFSYSGTKKTNSQFWEVNSELWYKLATTFLKKKKIILLWKKELRDANSELREKKFIFCRFKTFICNSYVYISQFWFFFFSENFKKTNQNCGILRHNYLFIYLFFFYFVVETGFHKSQSPFTFNVCKRAAWTLC